MDSRERDLERGALGGDRDAQTELRELWKRTGRDLLPSLIDPRAEAAAQEWTVVGLDLPPRLGESWRAVACRYVRQRSRLEGRILLSLGSPGGTQW